MRYPSVKTIMRIPRVTREQAKRVRGLMDGSIDPETSEAVCRWIRQCYHRPSDYELAMNAINETIETCGVEAIESEKIWIDSYHHNIVAVYCNTGDSYCPTVLLDHRSMQYRITSWADFVERNRL
jgi:hypothetical protein